MRPHVRRAAALLALGLAVTPLACSREGKHRETSATRAPASGDENPAAIPHPCPPQPSGPQTAGRDSLLNRFRPKLEGWAEMWAEAQPGFRLDSTWFVSRTKLEPLDTGTFAQPPRESAEDIAFGVLGFRSPDGRYTLYVDSYQVIEPRGETLEVGGEPDSRCALIDHRTGLESALGICGTSGGYHWGTWLTPRAFAVGAWLEADDYGQWKQARLSIYSIPDSTVTEYQSRIVSEADFARYMRAWHGWLLERYRSLRARRAS